MCACVCVCACVCACVRACVCMYVCVCARAHATVTHMSILKQAVPTTYMHTHTYVDGYMHTLHTYK